MKPLFSTLVAKYAEVFADVDFARRQFLTERDALLNRLARLSREPLNPMGDGFRGLFREDSLWQAAQHARGKLNQKPGFACFLGRDHFFGDSDDADALWFVSYAFFGSDAATGRLVRSRLDSTLAQQTMHRDQYMRVRIDAFRYGTPAFTEEALEAAVEALPGRFDEITSIVCAALTMPSA